MIAALFVPCVPVFLANRQNPIFTVFHNLFSIVETVIFTLFYSHFLR